MRIFVFWGEYSLYVVGANNEEEAERLAKEEGMDEYHELRRVHKTGEKFVEAHEG